MTDAPHMTPEEVNRIRFEVLGVSLSVLADRLGLAKKSGVQYIQSLESGKKEPSGPVALALRYMAQDWVHKGDVMPPKIQPFEVWYIPEDCLVVDCELYANGDVTSDAAMLVIRADEWTYWRACTRPPPGLTMAPQQEGN